MFSEGLDSRALRWVREGHASFSNPQHRLDTLHGPRNPGRGLGIPPPEKFRSGHLPRVAIPMSHTIPTEDESDLGSDVDEFSDTEAEVYGGRYFVDSSPPDDVSGRREPNGASAAAGSRSQYTVPVSGQHYYSSDGYSDFSSSRDTARRQPQQPRKQVHENGYMEEEEEDGLSDSGWSSVSQVGRNNGGVGVASRGSYHTESFSRNVPFRGDVKANVQRAGVTSQGSYLAGSYSHKVPIREDATVSPEKVGINSRGNYHSGSCSRHVPIRQDVKATAEMNGVSDVPSAPPIHGCDQKISQPSEQIPAMRSYDSHTACSKGPAIKQEAHSHVNDGSNIPDQNARDTSSGVEVPPSSSSFPARVPTFHASAQGPWHSVIAYDACVRLCLYSWARDCMEAPVFLESECALLRSAFGLQQILLQSEEELLAKRSPELVSLGAAPKPKKTIGKMKVQVRKVRMSLDMPYGCGFSSLKAPMLKLESLRHRMSNLQSTLSLRWESLKKVRVLPHLPPNTPISRHSLAYMHASAQYIKQVSGLLKIGVTTLCNSSSCDVVHETYSCQLKLKSSTEEGWVQMQPGSGETHVFFPDSLGDNLIVDVYDSKGKSCGRVVAQVANIAENPSEKLRWWSIYHEPEHELVGRIQLYVYYTTSPDENNALKCGSVAETVAYDIVMEVAMKAQHFRQRNLLLHGQWKWLLTEFASYYGVSDSYTRLRYLTYVMDVATPTADCLILVHDLLLPVMLKSRSKNTLSHQENRILGEIEEQIEQILAMVFENYKSLDESLLSGTVEDFWPCTGTPAPALEPAVKLYTLLHDILSPEAQLKLFSYFQVAAKKRMRRHLVETDEYVAGNSEGNLMDAVTISTAYQKMRSLCLNIRNEIFTDIEIHNQHVLPSFIDLPNLSASIYSVELCSRLRAFLVACAPIGPSPPVADLVIATSDFQRDLASWSISPIKGGVDAKELFHLYITSWIQDKRLALLESCKLDTVKWSGVKTQHMTTPFVDDMYDRLKDILNEYEVIICRWPEYTFVLENAIADIEKAVVEALEKQYADVLAPLKDSMTPKKFGLKYVQKLAKRNSICPYTVPDELGILLNTMKRMIDVLRPKIEMQLKSWGSCIPNGGNVAAEDRLGEANVSLKAKFRNYLQAVVEKLTENTHAQSTTKLKKIIQDSKDVIVESDIRSRMQPLKDQLNETINHLHTVFEVHVFIALCRGFWHRMGQDVLSFLENRKENRAWYKGARVTVAVLDDTFASQMQQLLGNALQEKDLEPPRSIMEVRSVLCKDAPVHKDSNFYY